MCTADVTLCHHLTYVVAAPVTTRVLIITDGHLSSVDRTNLSLLFNLALLSLGRNGIETVQEDALEGLIKLRTLLLEHNALTSSSLADHTFSQLRSLEVLVLSNNALRTLRGAWFRSTQGLTRLQLDGNQITNLTESSFAGTDLHNLRHLDLSNNFISFIEKNAFWPLPKLQEVDLSRNKLAHMPDIFTPLKHLTLLSLDKNRWSCTCDLHPLAHFLRNFLKSSAHTLRNANDLNCQPSNPAVAMKSVLGLSETNCGSKASNLSLGVKDRRPLLPGEDVALLTVLGFAGAVGLTCLGLVVFNWKLQQGKANEHTSENLCCRTFDESLCAHEARNHHAKGYCNCHLTQEDEIKVTSIVGSRKEMPLLQKNSHQATLASESTALDRSFKNLKGKDRWVDSSSFCLDGRLLQSGCSEPSGNRSAFNDAGLVTRHCPRRDEKLRNLKPGEVKSQTLPQLVTRTLDISSDTFRRRYATPASALARESLEKHLTNESWQPPMEKRDNSLQPHGQRHFITSSTSKLCGPEEHYVQKILHKHRSKYDDPCGLLKQNMTSYFQPNNALICKYVSCDEFQNYVGGKKSNHTKSSKFEKQQIQINNAVGKFLMNKDNVDLSRLSTKIKKTYSPKRVNVQDSDLIGKKRLVMSPKTSTHWKQQGHPSNQLTTLDLNKCSNSADKNKGQKWFANSKILKKKRVKQSDLKRKCKEQHLRLKLSLHPFRKVRVYPESSLLELPKKHKQVFLSLKKLPKTFERKAKTNLMYSAEFPQQPESNGCVKLTSKRLSPRHTVKQTPSHKRKSKKAPPFGANNVSPSNQSSTKDRCHSTSHVSDRNSPALPQPTPGDAEHTHPCSQFFTEQMEGATQLKLEIPSYLPDTLENAGNVSPSQQPREVRDPKAPEPTGHIEQNKSKTSELKQFSLPLRCQTELLDVFQTENCIKKHTVDQSQILQFTEQDSNHKELGNEEKVLMKRPKISHQMMESYTMDQEENYVGKKPPNAESYDSSHIPRTQSKDSLPSTVTNSISYQNRVELSNDIDISSSSSQTTWHQTNNSENGNNITNALHRDGSTEVPEIKMVEKKQKNIFDERNKTYGMITMTAQMPMEGTGRERQLTWENGKREQHVLSESSCVEEAMGAKDVSIPSSHETRNRMPSSETDLETNSNVPDLKEMQNIQSDSSTLGKDAMVRETHEVLPLLPELKDINFEAENEVPLMPSRINEAENSAPKPALHPPSAEYANTSPLEAEQREKNNANNNNFLL